MRSVIPLSGLLACLILASGSAEAAPLYTVIPLDVPGGEPISDYPFVKSNTPIDGALQAKLDERYPPYQRYYVNDYLYYEEKYSFGSVRNGAYVAGTRTFGRAGGSFVDRVPFVVRVNDDGGLETIFTVPYDSMNVAYGGGVNKLNQYFYQPQIGGPHLVDLVTGRDDPLRYVSETGGDATNNFGLLPGAWDISMIRDLDDEGRILARPEFRGIFW